MPLLGLAPSDRTCAPFGSSREHFSSFVATLHSHRAPAGAQFTVTGSLHLSPIAIVGFIRLGSHGVTPSVTGPQRELWAFFCKFRSLIILHRHARPPRTQVLHVLYVELPTSR